MKNLGKKSQSATVEMYVSNLKQVMISEIKNTMEQKKMTHQMLSNLSGIPRSSVTGILSGSVQKVSVDRILKLMTSLGKEVKFNFKD